MSPVATQTKTSPTVTVRASTPLIEGEHQYSPGDVFEVNADRGRRLIELKLVTAFTPGDSSSGPRLEVAKREAGEAYNQVQTLTRQRQDAERSLATAETEAQALRGCIAQTTDAETMRTLTADWIQADQRVESIRKLVDNICGAINEAETRKTQADAMVRTLEQRAAWLRTVGIPGAQRAITTHEAEIEAQEKRLAGMRDHLSRNLQPALTALDAELRGLIG